MKLSNSQEMQGSCSYGRWESFEKYQVYQSYSLLLKGDTGSMDKTMLLLFW